MHIDFERGQGELFVLIPALLCDSEMYRQQCELLSRQRKVLVLQSDGEEDIPSAADALVELLRKRGLRRMDLAGTSMGGYIAQEVCLRHPGLVRRLVLMDTRAAADTQEARDTRETVIATLEAGRFQSVLDGFLPKILSAQSLENPELFARVRQMCMRLGPQLMARQHRMMLHRRDTRDALSSLRIPTLCLGGAQDQLTPPAMMRELADLLPHGRWVVIPGNVGHLAAMEAPEAVSRELLAFLS